MISTPEEPLPDQATTGLSPAQFDELVTHVEERVIWDGGIGRPRQLTLRQAVKATIMYFKTNVTEELIGELLFVDQTTISRAISDLEEVIAEVLAEFVPDLAEEVNRRVVVVDGSLCPCWSWANAPELYSGKHTAPRRRPVAYPTQSGGIGGIFLV
jgi:restriction endonuclease Mrr